MTYPYPLDTDQIDGVIELLANDYPAITRRFQLVFPSQDLARPIYGLRIGKSEDKHGVLLLGGLHARELFNPDLLLAFATQLCDAYTRGTGLQYGPISHPAMVTKILVESLTLFFVPLMNPDGRIWVQTTSEKMWRKNRRTNSGSSCRGADVNRNFDFLWAEGIGTSTDPCNYNTYRGPSPASDNETRNLTAILDTFANIRSMIDMHSYSQYVLYPWGDAPNQTIDTSMSFQNPTWNGKRTNPGYGEYLPSRDNRRFARTAAAVADAIGAVHGTVYEPTQTYFMDAFGPTYPTYPTSATSNDYAYSRHFVGQGSKVWAYAMEAGNKFQPTPDEAAHWIPEVSNGLVTFLLRSLCALDELLQAIFGADWLTVSASFRAFRDEKLLTSTVGQRLMDLLDDDGAEALAIVRSDERLQENVSELLIEVANTLLAFQEGKRVKVEPQLVRKLDAAARQIGREASPQLKSTMKELRAVLANFAGATIPQGLKKSHTAS